MRDMDWENPLRSIAATVDVDVLRVLVVTHEPVTGNQLALLAGRSYAQVYAVVRRMADDGLVVAARYGRTNTYRLNHDHILANGILRMVSAPSRIESEIRHAVQSWDPSPASVALVGAAAHRRVARDGTIRILIIRPDAVSASNPAWRSQIDALAGRLEVLAGNSVEIIEFDRSELRVTMTGGRSQLEALPSEARRIFGEDLRRWVAH